MRKVWETVIINVSSAIANFGGITSLSSDYFGYTLPKSASGQDITYEGQRVIEIIGMAGIEEPGEDNLRFFSSSTIAQPSYRIPCTQLPQNTE